MKKFKSILISFFILLLSLSLKAQYNYSDYTNNLFSGNYKKTANILLHLRKTSKNSIKIHFAFADFYYIMFETTGGMEIYNGLCKKEADYIIKVLRKKEHLTETEIFYLVSAKALVLKIQLERKHFLKVAKEFKSIMKQLVYAKNHPSNPLLRLVAGMYNYHIEQAGLDHPIVSPILLFFPSGNKTKGLSLLKQCTKFKDVYIKISAFIFLSRIYDNKEHDFNKAQYYHLQLLKRYPNNIHWLKNYIFTLKRFKKYTEAKIQKNRLLKLIDKNPQLTNSQRTYLKSI